MLAYFKIFASVIDRWEIVSQCCFNLHFFSYEFEPPLVGLRIHFIFLSFISTWIICSHLFPIFLSKCLVLCASIFKSSLYIRNVTLLSLTYVAEISQFVSHLLTWFMVVFWPWKGFHFYIIKFTDILFYCLWILSHGQKAFPYTEVKEFTSAFF